jgi:hypothetical protein
MVNPKAFEEPPDMHYLYGMLTAGWVGLEKTSPAADGQSFCLTEKSKKKMNPILRLS